MRSSVDALQLAHFTPCSKLVRPSLAGGVHSWGPPENSSPPFEFSEFALTDRAQGTRPSAAKQVQDWLRAMFVCCNKESREKVTQAGAKIT